MRLRWLPSVLLLLVFSISTYAYAGQSEVEDAWKRLLHYKQGKSAVLSKHFFLSSEQEVDPLAELKAHIERFNSPLGQETACRFPLRYLYLKSKNLVPEFSLRQCEALNRFVQSYQQNHISLIFTSEYITVPESAFGHLMVLLHDSTTLLKNADAVHFTVKSIPDDFLAYLRKGVSGDYRGYYLRESFDNKIYQYNEIEQRFMHIYRLDFSQEEIQKILYHLFELREVTFAYDFIDENCGSKIIDLLNIAKSVTRQKSTFYHMPIEGVLDYREYIVDSKVYPPLMHRSDHLISKMGREEKAVFEQALAKEASEDQTHDSAKESLLNYTKLNRQTFQKLFPFHDTDAAMEYKKESPPLWIPDPLRESLPSSLGVGWYGGKERALLFSYRPLYKELSDIQSDQLQKSALTLFAFDLAVGNGEVKIDRLDFFKMRSHIAATPFDTPLSLALQSTLLRENTLHDLEWENEVGLGQSYRLSNIFATFMLNAGLDEKRAYLKPLLRLSTSFKGRFKVAWKSYRKHYQESSYRFNQFLATYRGDLLSYTLSYENDSSMDDQLFRVLLQYRF